MKLVIAIVVLALAGCAAQNNSSEAAWRRGQCAQILDEKMRTKCLDQVDSEFGSR
jgi:outer membrane lipoprotein SlyB